MSVSRQMAKGAFWMVLFKLTERGIGFVSTLILARILVPADFGLIAMATAILAVLELLSTFSFDLALIQNANAGRRHYDTAWTFDVIFGVVNAIGLAALALPAASFYSEPRVAGVMVVLALSVLVRGFSNIGVVAFQKELQFHKEFKMGVAKKLIGFSVTVPLALILHTYWALLAGQFASSVAGVVLSYLMHPYRPRFSLQGRKELFHFSKWMALNNILISLAQRLPDFIIGKVAGTTALGTYSIAYEISNLLTTEMVMPIGRAVFPGYSKMATQGNALRVAFTDVLSVILLVAVPAGLGIMVLAEPIVLIFLGSKWKDAIPLIQLLSVFGMLRAANSNTGSIYVALGKPQLLTYVSVLFVATLVAGLVWLVPQSGAHGAAVAIVLTAVIQVPINYWLVMKKISLGIGALASVVWRPIVSGVAMAWAVGALRTTVAPLIGDNVSGYAVQLAVLVPVGAALYVLLVLGLWFFAGRPRGSESILLTVAGESCQRFGRWRAKLL